MAAAKVGEQLQRQRQERARQDRDHSIRETVQLAQRTDAELTAARATLAAAGGENWTGRAGLAKVAEAVEAREAWRDKLTAKDAASVDREIFAKTGIDLATPPGDRERPDEAATRLADRVQAKREADGLRTWGSADVADAWQHLQEADWRAALADELDQQAEVEGTQLVGLDSDELVSGSGPVMVRRVEELRDAADQQREMSTELEGKAATEWDSAHRHDALADRLEAKGIDNNVKGARLTADRAQATSPRAAVDRQPRRTPKARKTKRGQGFTQIRGR